MTGGRGPLDQNANPIVPRKVAAGKGDEVFTKRRYPSVGGTQYAAKNNENAVVRVSHGCGEERKSSVPGQS